LAGDITGFNPLLSITSAIRLVEVAERRYQCAKAFLLEAERASAQHFLE